MSYKITLAYKDVLKYMKDHFKKEDGHTKLYNPYSPESQDNLSIAKGWGVTVLDGSNTEKEISERLSYQRQFEIVLTRKIFAGKINTEEAIAEREAKEIEILEQHATIAKHFQSDTYLTDGNYNNIAGLKVDTDSGLLFLREGQYDIVMMRLIVPIEYFEVT